MNPQLVRWVMENRDRYTPEALRAKLLEFRHRPADIDRLLSTEDLASLLAGAERGERAKARVTWVVVVAYLGGFVLLGAVSVGAWGSGSPVPLLFLATTLLIGGLLGVVIARAVAGNVFEGGAAGVLVSLIVPALYLAIVAGLCLQAAQPGFP